MTPATPDYWNRLADEAQAAVSNRLLDVERLARAVYNVWERKGGFGPGLAVSERGHADIAEDFAAEYAALFAATPSAEPEEGTVDADGTYHPTAEDYAMGNTAAGHEHWDDR